MKRRCRHEVTCSGYRYGQAWMRVCQMCHELVSLGPANDAPAEVQIEIRAAELARLYVERKADPPIEWCNIVEWLGFENDKLNRGSAAYDADYDAGWLARAIVTHDEPVTTEARRPK